MSGLLLHRGRRGGRLWGRVDRAFGRAFTKGGSACRRGRAGKDPPARADDGPCDAGRRGLHARGLDHLCRPLGRAFAKLRVVPVDLPASVLHLKCVCSPLGDDLVALAEESIPAKTFDAKVVWIPASELYAANLVAIGQHAIVAEGYPRAHEALASAGFSLHPVPVSEVRKADGSLTCQSIIVSQGQARPGSR